MSGCDNGVSHRVFGSVIQSDYRSELGQLRANDENTHPAVEEIKSGGTKKKIRKKDLKCDKYVDIQIQI